MAKTIYIHIGHYKTGTTALQVFMNSNRDTLRELGTLWRKGVDYPEQFCDLAKHTKLAFSIYREAGVSTLLYGFQNEVPAKTRWAEFFEYVRNSKCPSVLISSEEFMRMGANPAACDIFKDIIAPVRNEFNFKIIAYLRRPDAHLRSWYNQLVKLKQPVPDFNSTVCDLMEPIHYDYSLALKPWIELFGEKSVVVRPYTEALRENGELFRDFLGILGIPFDGKNASRWDVPGNGINLRLEDRFLELTRVAQNVGMKPERVELMRERFAKQLDAHQPREDRATGFDQVVETARGGLEALKTNPQTAGLATLYADHLPDGDTADRAEMLSLVQMLLQENTVLRNRLNATSLELKNRLSAIEDHLGISKPGSQ
ncbi:hypothetical protein [Shimia sp. MIT1388]|uniref:hypothetical protein n=1 Tax=Shimia sp. MIT1388 TaxID=3096992 RepID=UPI00399AD0B9